MYHEKQRKQRDRHTQRNREAEMEGERERKRKSERQKDTVFEKWDYEKIIDRHGQSKVWLSQSRNTCLKNQRAIQKVQYMMTRDSGKWKNKKRKGKGEMIKEIIEEHNPEKILKLVMGGNFIDSFIVLTVLAEILWKLWEEVKREGRKKKEKRVSVGNGF